MMLMSPGCLPAPRWDGWSPKLWFSITRHPHPGGEVSIPPQVGSLQTFHGKNLLYNPQVVATPPTKNGMILVDILVVDLLAKSPTMGPWGYMLGGPSRPKYCFSRCLEKRGNLWILIHFGLSNLQTIPLLNVFCLVLYIADWLIIWPTSVPRTRNIHWRAILLVFMAICKFWSNFLKSHHLRKE